MKTKYGLSASSLVIAMTMATAANAHDGAAIIVPETEALFADAIGGSDEASTEEADRADGYVTVEATADEFAPLVMDIPALAAPAWIEGAAQRAIHAVDFTADAGEGLVNLPAHQAFETQLPQIGAPFAINDAAQAAIYSVDFPKDIGGGMVSVPAVDAGEWKGPVVTARSLSSYNLHASSGNIDAFYGDIVAFYGNIDAFWGDINPFYGDINPFYGDISPFYGDINPFYGDINPFYGNIDAFWGDIVAFDRDRLQSIGEFGKALSTQIGATEADWASLKYSISSTGSVSLVYDGAPNRIRGELATLISQAKAQYGAAYTAKTGKSFEDGFVADILARHGIDLSDNTAGKTTLAKSAAQRSAFYLDWHDSLMAYAGIDHVDHWMGTINWTPSIMQIQGEGKQAIIGIVDGSFSSDAKLANNIVWAGGGTTSVNGHGAGVASLIAGAHDGEGVMGIAPKVKIAAYNPFDANHKASWDSVADGIQSLLFQYVGGNDTGYVSAINLSLGEKGIAFSQGLADVLNRPTINAWSHETIYVVAAGNEGVAQTADINWNGKQDTNFILVGSVDPSGQISNFSNRPGDACLLTGGVCTAGNRLMDRFIVAPGSMLLVSDGQGGLTRSSGTSFAAPLVSGAVSLLHDRWKWLVKNPDETAEIILRSARDLGAPGVDEVYGWGLLDVAASQSPLDFNSLSFNVYQKQGSIIKSYPQSVSQLLAHGSVPNWWETSEVFITAFETIGKTFRDFSIPMSSLKRGTTSDVLGHGQQRMQDFVADRFANWLLSGGADRDGDGKVGISQLRSNEAETSGQWTMRFDGIAPRFVQDGAVRPVHSAATLTTPDGKASFTLGHGEGAMSLTGARFGIASDYDARTGGVNPVLGLASGEVFGGASYNIAPDTKISVGFAAEREDADDLDNASDLDRQLQQQWGAREAQALTFGVEQKVTDNLSFGVQYTHLDEADAVLGLQTGSDALLGQGSRTDALTFSASFNAGNGLSLDLSLTGGATDLNDGQLLATSQRAVSTAGQVAIAKRGVMNSRDVMRFSIGQPLSVESGELEFTSDQVIDRETGEIGQVTQSIGIDTKRRIKTELVYATPVADNAEFGLMGRYVTEGEVGQEHGFMIGANFGLRF